jgi:hypothetical protein
VEILEKRAKTLLASSVDWNKVYLRLSSSALSDERWNARNFSKQRIKDVMEALKWLEQHDIAEHNVASISTAKLAMLVLGVAGAKSTKASVDDFLPFDTRRIKKDHGITDETLRVLHKLMKTKTMDGRVIGLLAEELKAAANRNDNV